MKIALVGAGRIGGRLARAWANAGHQLTIGVRDVNAADVKELTQETSARATTVEDAVNGADVVVLAVPHGAIDGLLPTLAPLVAGKIVIDCTNHMMPDRTTLKFGTTTSAAEEIAKRLPGARVVKSFNSQGAELIANPIFNGVPASNFFCGDDEEARRVVGGLVKDVGFEPVDAGPLKSARYIEPLTLLWFAVGSQGGTRDLGFKVLRR